ncbi:MAG: sugar ABC transporter ATP-binding protein [Lachnospiraceae bacterium]|jgi:ABC-type sugar transport system ATPase subunit
MGNQKEVVLEMKNITKEFSGVQALKGIDFELRKGEIHALMGENGAGKSTMIKMLAGVHMPTSGEIYIDGKKVEIKDVATSKSFGIATIHQELSLVPHMTVAENIYLGRIPTGKSGLVNDKKLHEDALEVLKELGLEEIIGTHAVAGELTVAQQQMVEIARAISAKSRILIMDEPTASLTEREIDHMLEFVMELREKGVSIIYISHRMEEIFRISDRITVFRDGEYISTKDTSDVTYDDLVKLMVGRDLSGAYPAVSVPVGEEILRVENLVAGRQVQDISFTLKKGEVLGFYGLVGAGRTETMRALFGIDQKESGKVFVEGNEVEIKNMSDAIAAGLALAPENRKEQGLILLQDIKYNVVLPILKQIIHGIKTDKKKEDAIVEEYMNRMSVKATSSRHITRQLSGGNQQKVVLAKWLATHPKILVLDEPTRGIDIGAKFQIYEIITQLVDEGIGVIFISSELPEMINLSTRILVMREGKMMGEIANKEDMTEENVMKLATGGI